MKTSCPFDPTLTEMTAGPPAPAFNATEVVAADVGTDTAGVAPATATLAAIIPAIRVPRCNAILFMSVTYLVEAA